MFFKKGIHPIVSVTLLVALSITSGFLFQNWFTSFFNSFENEIYQTENSYNFIKIDALIDNTLYISSEKEDEIIYFSISQNNNILCSFNQESRNSSSLVGWWKFNEENQTLKDFSGNSNDGVLYGSSKILFDFDTNVADDKTIYNNDGILNGVTLVSNCVSNNCFYFDGSNDYIEIMNSTSINLNHSFSINFWVKPNTTSFIDSQRLVDKYATNYQGPYFTFTNKSTFEFHVVLNNTNFNLNSSPVTLGSWYMLTGIFNEGNISFYINGNLIQENISTQKNLINASWNLYLGTNDGVNDFFQGYIDEFALYSKPLTKNDILTLYNNKKITFIEYSETSKDKGVRFSKSEKIYGEVPASQSLNINGNGITMFANIILEDEKNSRQRIFTKYSPGYSLSVRSPLQVAYNDRYYEPFLNLAGSWRTCLNNENLSLHSYYSLVTTYNGSEIRTYVNGKLKNICQYSGNINTNVTAPLYFGRATGENEFFDGIIDEVRIYNSSLNENEIENLFFEVNNKLKNKENVLDVSACNLNKKEGYEIILLTKKGKVIQTVIAK
jgi:hypothetical protein